MFKIASIEHALATVAHDIVKGAKAVDSFIQKAAGLAKADQPFIDQLLQEVDPAAVPLERAAFAALGLVAKAAGEADQVAAAKGLNITLDAQALADFKTIYAQLSSKAKLMAAAGQSS